MEPFFEFLGNYWWLAFPLFGVVAGLGNAWEQGAKRRHKRRLEVMKAKAELKAAQSAARRGVTAPHPLALPVTDAGDAGASAADSQRSQLEKLFATHDDITKRWLDYELDVAKLIAFPAMSDGRQPLTAAFLRAKRVADGLRPATAKARITKEQLAEYRSAVTDFDVAFDLAERDARRIKDSTFTDLERKRLDTAKQLLSVAIDQAATPAERQLAYRRVRQELDGLISVSDEALVILEEKVALELTTGAVPETPDAAAQTSASTATSAPEPEPLPVRQRPAGESASTWPVPARSPKPPAPSA